MVKLLLVDKYKDEDVPASRFIRATSKMTTPLDTLFKPICSD